MIIEGIIISSIRSYMFQVIFCMSDDENCLIISIKNGKYGKEKNHPENVH